ncbi:hypothetical protein [Methylobacterium sp. 77]|uniref:hypothetical protein n=1 Tax=Methylobacterium sp. 77 TaxID=1101192 RepID=UPI0003706704|nr:hypothetical protein [Methylobacterium sp. 77]
MSGIFAGFGSAGGGGGVISVPGRGVVFQLGGTKDNPLLMGLPIHGRGGIRIENNDGVDGPLTIWNMPDGVLMTAEGVDCSATTEIELGMATQDGQDTYIIDTVTFWGATSAPTVLRGSVYSGSGVNSTLLVPATQSFAALTSSDVVLDVPVQVKRAARYGRLLWKPSVTENIRINIAVYRRLLRQVEVF